MNTNSNSNPPVAKRGPKTMMEYERHMDKKAFQIRMQQDKEQKRALSDFQKHWKEEMDND